jgi:Raf kinase inhibitor-like YbhB/YbcL family protein
VGDEIRVGASINSAFVITSAAFADNGVLQRKYAGGCLAGHEGCLGGNISPPLAWQNAPAGTRSFALLMFDPEGRKGLGFTHLVVYGIPATTYALREGALSEPSDGHINGNNDAGNAGYLGPCTPPGAYHHYIFTIIATDLHPRDLPPGLTADQLRAALAGHALRATGIVARYRHPRSY